VTVAVVDYATAGHLKLGLLTLSAAAAVVVAAVVSVAVEIFESAREKKIMNFN
jgi:hypothetical protein